VCWQRAKRSWQALEARPTRAPRRAREGGEGTVEGAGVWKRGGGQQCQRGRGGIGGSGAGSAESNTSKFKGGDECRRGWEWL